MSEQAFKALANERILQANQELNKDLERVLEYVDRTAVLEAHREALEIEADMVWAENQGKKAKAKLHAEELASKRETINALIDQAETKQEWAEIYERKKTIEYLGDLLLEAAKKLAPIIKDLAVKHGKELLGG